MRHSVQTSQNVVGLEVAEVRRLCAMWWVKVRRDGTVDGENGSGRDETSPYSELKGATKEKHQTERRRRRRTV